MDVNKIFIRSVILYLFDKGLKESEVFEEITKLYGQNTVSITTVYRWFYNYRLGHRSLEDNTIFVTKSEFSDDSLTKSTNEKSDSDTQELYELENNRDNTASKSHIQNNNQNPTHIKKEFKNSIKFSDDYLINLVNENPDLNMKELANLSNSAVSTIRNRLKRINNNGEKVYYCRKGVHKGAPTNTTKNRCTDEYLIKLINDNPSLNMEELGKLAGITRKTISLRLKKINSLTQRAHYIKKK